VVTIADANLIALKAVRREAVSRRRRLAGVPVRTTVPSRDTGEDDPPPGTKGGRVDAGGVVGPAVVGRVVVVVDEVVV